MRLAHGISIGKVCEPADNCAFFCGNGYLELETGFCVYKRIRQTVWTIQSVGDWKLYIILTGQWKNIILNVHAPTWGKFGKMKGGFYQDLQHIFSQFSKYQNLRSSTLCTSYTRIILYLNVTEDSVV
jgi:hypothetical protein